MIFDNKILYFVKFNKTPLYLAIENEYIEIIKFLLQIKKLDINSTDI